MPTMKSAPDYMDRCRRLQEYMEVAEVDYILVGPSSDLLYLIGLNRPQSERLTLFLLPRRGPGRLVLPGFERALADPLASFFELATWEEDEDPTALFVSLLPDRGRNLRLAVGGKLFVHFLFKLQKAAPQAVFIPGNPIIDPMRMRKEKFELENLSRAGKAADKVFEALLESPLVGKTEVQMKAQIMELLPQMGHDAAGGAIVAVGPNAASPHHHVSARVIGNGDPIIIDFGGMVNGYWSDMTRTIHIGEPSEKFLHAYNTVKEANDKAFEAVKPGVTAEYIDRVARDHIRKAGYGEYFLHRTGHGIGLDIHELPFIVKGEDTSLAPGMVFSIEPGIYIKGEFGIRIEDIVAVTDTGGRRLNNTTRELQVIAA